MPTIDSLLAEPKLLPQIPEVMRDLIQTFNEKDPDLLKISKLINKDPVISANMVLACGLTESVTAVPGIDLKHFWGCVFNVAELARRLAVKKGMKGDEVFTCALLYDLGRLVMHVGLPENTVHHIHDLELHKGRAKAEELVVGFNYAQVGAAMARYWKFPETISNAVEYHYNPMLAKEFSPEAGLIHLAIVLAAQSDVGEEAPPEWPHKVADALGLSWADCAAQFTALREQGNGYAGLLAA